MDKFIEKGCQISQLSWQIKDFLIATVLSTTNPPPDPIAKQHYLKYIYEGIEFCRNAFLFLFGIGKDHLQNIRDYSLQNGISLHIHQNTSQKHKQQGSDEYSNQKQSHVDLDEQEIENFKHFFQTVGNLEGFPDPSKRLINGNHIS